MNKMQQVKLLQLGARWPAEWIRARLDIHPESLFKFVMEGGVFDNAAWDYAIDYIGDVVIDDWSLKDESGGQLDPTGASFSSLSPELITQILDVWCDGVHAHWNLNASFDEGVRDPNLTPAMIAWMADAHRTVRSLTSEVVLTDSRKPENRQLEQGATR